ncbi:MAG: sn-glycerol-3-phosphate ABC transporter ATP-binding protein UgpC [Pirellulales bacterium]|nr:sn-glycerol-3-phosphate ABC transporter ATP-binding protein UgpC [Pirellulales bacterium]
MGIIRLEHVYKRYDDGYVAVQDANLTIEDGEFLVLVGPSGCGKSTTLRMIAGLESISDGDVYIDGDRVNDREPGDRDIAMVFQNYALYPHMTVRANMGFGLKMRGVSGNIIEERVKDAASILSLEDLLDRRPKEMSGGQRQRVAVGRAIVRQPAAFLFDEPLSNLDAKLRVQMRTELSRLHQRLGTTTVYVTHDQVEAMTLGHRIVVMNRGIIQQVDTPLNLYHQPLNRFVAGFIGSPAMNFVEGSSRAGRFRSGEMEMEIPEAWARDNVTLGVRPEDLKIIDSSASDTLAVRVDVVERMGNETIGYFDFAGQPMVARLAGDVALSPGTMTTLAIRDARWHLFESGEEGTRLASGQADHSPG